MNTYELVLSFERDHWRARGAGIVLEHEELDGLNELIRTRLGAAEPASVHVRFDMRALPPWLRQYHAHYCNYVLHVGAHGAQE